VAQLGKAGRLEAYQNLSRLINWSQQLLLVAATNAVGLLHIQIE
jgi:hypothetical protein